MFGEWLKTLFFKPNLELIYDHHWPDAIKIPLNWNKVKPLTENDGLHGTGVCYFFRFRVKNKGNRPAKNIEVLITKIEKQNVDKSFQTYKTFIPLNLGWSNTQSSIYMPAIYPDLEKYCDLGLILHPQQKELDETIRFAQSSECDETVLSNIVFSLSFAVKPNVIESFMLQPGTYKIEASAVASNSTICKKTFELTFIDQWFDEPTEMLSQGIGLKLL